MSDVSHQRSFGPLEQAFASLGRAILVLDDEFCVLWASDSLDGLVCPGSAKRVVGKPVTDLLGGDVLERGRGIREVIEAGGRDEGRRAFLRCPELGARLVSVTVAALDVAQRVAFGPTAHALMVLRPAEDDHILLARGAGEMGFVAHAPQMLQVVHTIEQLQHSEVNVLITGESGTGKEVVARAIHAHSLRREGPFVPVNCAAIAPDLLESELFGHVRGAFTGAVSERKGRFELARGGTLFLDEIGDMPAQLQVKLLRVIQEREYQRLGESKTRPLDARIVSATNADLVQAIASGSFREDLYYRLAVVPLHVPPLRERRDDIPPLARHILARIGSRDGRTYILSPDALEALLRYCWPGNVRQLENALEFAVVLCEGGRVHAGLLPAELRQDGDTTARAARAAGGAGASPTSQTPASAEAERIRRVLEEHQWRRGPAAKALGLSRTTLWRKMRDLGIE